MKSLSAGSHKPTAKERTSLSVKICDYTGYSCSCQGFKPGKTSNLCVCGHYKSQHNVTGEVDSEEWSHD